MFKKILLRSVAGATAAGSALAMSLVAAPAVVTSAPEIRNVACDEKYQGSVSTTTQLSLERAVAIYGVSTTATAKVTRDEAGAKSPTGRVKFTLLNPGGGVRNAWVVGLSGGEASITLPQDLPARATYTVRARYMPGCSIFAGSSSAPAYYTVNKAGTRTGVNAPNITRGENARVNVEVRSGSPLTPVGQVRIVVLRQAKVLASQTHRLRGGKVSATFRKFPVGYYDVEVRYLGTRNFRASKGADDFRVSR